MRRDEAIVKVADGRAYCRHAIGVPLFDQLRYSIWAGDAADASKPDYWFSTISRL